MSALTIVSMAGAGSAVYLTAEAIVRAGHRRTQPTRRVLHAVAGTLALAAASIVVASASRDIVLGFVIGGVLTPIVANWTRRHSASGRPR